MKGTASEHGWLPHPRPSFTTFSHFLPLGLKIRFFLGNCQEKKLKKSFTKIAATKSFVGTQGDR
jgi:hypothetical protein